tara:strand:- start:788 stop:1390 length:603 start_codon:yes stop_codon:yes gene_type:complete
MGVSHIQATTVVDAQAASTTYVAAAAQPASTFTIANGSFTAGHARLITVTTTGTGDNAKTVTIVGTDLNGGALTEIIVSTGSAATVAGTKYFKTVTSATCSAQYAANASVGMAANATASITINRASLKAFSTISHSAAHQVDFIDGTTAESGSVVFRTKTSGVNNASDDVYIPDEGVLFASGLVIKYRVDGSHMVTAFHA